MKIARQQQMVAVVDDHVRRAIIIRTAAATGLLGRFVDMNLESFIREPNTRGQAGDPGADDMSFCHQMNAYRMRMKIFAALLSLTGLRGRAKPRSTSFSRIAW